MHDSRQLRFALAIGLSAAISAIAVEYFIRPSLMRGMK